MSAGIRKVPTRFESETWFDVVIPAAPFRGAEERKLDQFKNQLMEQMSISSAKGDLLSRYQHAATEAATLAWMTPYPLLVLPVLLEEKILAAKLHAERQSVIRGKSQLIMAEAA